EERWAGAPVRPREHRKGRGEPPPPPAPPPAREADDAPSWDSLRAAGDSGVLASGQEPAWAAAGPTAMLPRSNAAPEEPLAARGGGAATGTAGAVDDYHHPPPHARAR